MLFQGVGRALHLGQSPSGSPSGLAQYSARRLMRAHRRCYNSRDKGKIIRP